MLAKIVGVDTIPFLLKSKERPLKLMGFHHNELNNKEELFFTQFFRIEDLDRETSCATVSLLLPLDIHGNFTDELCDVMILRRTSTCETVDLSCICAIQVLDTDLLKREIIIEPKW